MVAESRKGRVRKTVSEDKTETVIEPTTTPEISTPQTEKTANEITIDAAIDERLNAAIAASNFRITLNNQRQNARLALQKGLTFSINGGVFNIDSVLISLVQTFISMGKESAILLDVNKNPIEIESLENFQESIVNIYFEKMNEFLVEFKSIQKSRTAKALIGV